MGRRFMIMWILIVYSMLRICWSQRTFLCRKSPSNRDLILFLRSEEYFLPLLVALLINIGQMRKLLMCRLFWKISATLKNVKRHFLSVWNLFLLFWNHGFHFFFYLCTIELFEENITLAFTFSQYSVNSYVIDWKWES